jgi:AraC-like DNA-binding protein
LSCGGGTRSGDFLRAAIAAFTRARDDGALAIDTLRQTLEEDGAVASLVTDLDGGSAPRERHLIDYTMMGSLRTLRMAAGADFRLVEAHLRCAPPADAADVERAYGCPVRFRQRDDRVLFPRHVLDARSGMSNPLVAAELEKLLEALSATSPQAAFRARAEAATRALVAAGQRPTAPVIARRMHVSARTLQRRLEEEQTTFNAIRDAVLRDITIAQLRSPRLSIKEIASSVGFTDVATFSKAFKRWTGRSPSDFRAHGLA